MDIQLIYNQYCEHCKNGEFDPILDYKKYMLIKTSCVGDASELIFKELPIMWQPRDIKNPILIEKYEDGFYNLFEKQAQPNNSIEMEELCDLFEFSGFGFGSGALFEPIHEHSLSYAIYLLRWCEEFLTQTLNNIPNNEHILLCFLAGIRSFDCKRLALKLNKDDEGSFYIADTIYINENTEGMYLIDFVMKYCT